MASFFSAMETRSRGFSIHYEVSGDGPPVLLVHGIFMSAANYRDLGYVSRLAESYRVIAVDLLGHGVSDKPAETDAYIETGMLKDLVAVLDAEGIERAHYWGYSLGGHLGYPFATTFPERLRSLTIGGYSTARPAEWRQVMLGRSEALHRGDFDRVSREFGVSDEVGRAILGQNDVPAMAAVMQAMASSETPNASEVRAPALVYMGSKERDVDAAKKDAELMHASFLVVEDTDHAGTFQAMSIVVPAFREHVEKASRYSAS